MSGTIEEFDDDTDFALPVTTVASTGANGGDDESIRMAQMQDLMRNMQGGEGSGMMGGNPNVDTALSAEAKKWITVYPIYFDAKRKYMKGCRRVAHEHSCLWPKSTFIESAAARLTLMHAHESQKTHPQDWENPGRVKIQLFDENGKPKNRSIQSKKALLNAIAALIQPQCGGKPPPLPKRTTKSKGVVVPKALENEKGTSHVNNKNAASKLLKKGRRVSRKVQAEDRIKGSRPPPLSARYPLTSPAREAGLLNADLGGMMGGLQGMGPLGAMMGQMGMGGDDDDDEAQAEAERLKEEEEKKKKKDPMQQLSRRQKKRVVRIGR